MKTFMFVDLTLIAVLIGLTCSPAARSESAVFGIFEGTSPCDAVSRKPLQIPTTVNCEMIKWSLILFQNRDSIDPTTYELNFSYGLSQSNTNGLINGGTKVARRGRWTTAHGTTTAPNAVTFELDKGSAGAMSFLKLDHNVLHLLDSDRNLAVGNAGWSYTLSRRDTLQKQTDLANATATSSFQSAQINSLSTGAPLSSVLGRFVGRSPCVQVARELRKTVGADCMKVKWDLTLYQDSKTLAQTTYELRGTFYRDRIRKGTWTVLRGARGNRAAVVYQLNADAPDGSLMLLKGDDNILFFLDGDRNLMIGNGDFSYTLNRKK